MARIGVKERLLQAGLDLFSSHGFNVTGVKDIVDAAGIPKGSFYAHFESKDALGCAVVDRYWDQGSRSLATLATGCRPPTERLKAHFCELSRSVASSQFLVGCLLGRFSAEIVG